MTAASANERLLLNNGLSVSPLNGPVNGTTPQRSLREVVHQIDNERDLNSYVAGFASKVPPRASDIRYQPHPVCRARLTPGPADRRRRVWPPSNRCRPSVGRHSRSQPNKHRLSSRHPPNSRATRALRSSIEASCPARVPKARSVPAVDIHSMPPTVQPLSRIPAPLRFLCSSLHLPRWRLSLRPCRLRRRKHRLVSAELPCSGCHWTSCSGRMDRPCPSSSTSACKPSICTGSTSRASIVSRGMPLTLPSSRPCSTTVGASSQLPLFSLMIIRLQQRRLSQS